MKRTSNLFILFIVSFAVLLIGCRSQSECEPAQVNNADLSVGDEAPDFRLPDHTGGYVRLSDFEGKSNVILAFFPAAFTPV
jgi:peroxiredoxin